MNLHEKSTTVVERRRLAEDLCEAALVDTVYGDLYLQRARDFLAPVLSEAEFASLQLLETEALNLPNRIYVAVKEAKWAEVKNLSSRIESLKRALADKENVRQLGEKIYALGEPPLDPFSPGLQELARRGDPQALLDKLLTQLDRLQKADPDWQDFYATRRSAMAAIKTYSSQVPKEGKLSGSQLEGKALEALNKGDFSQLEKMADLMEKEEPGGTERASGSPWRVAGESPNLTFKFPQEVLNRARDLGLAPIRMEAGSRFLNISPEELARLYGHLWHPAFARKKEIPLPADAPAALQDLVELFTLRPFVNSGGARYVPALAEEDVLVEDFDEPDPGMEAPASALLSALRFDDRLGLSRIRLEKALVDRGNAIIGDIGLDVRIFRLVCIPPDVYGRVGSQRGWGRKPMWTHFDGYMVTKNGRLQALAGGDVRYGGLYDLVGIGREYHTAQILTRFAVVQRRRMEAVG
jgi:polyhydroxyalkanoate synthesis regulator phasin